MPDYQAAWLRYDRPIIEIVRLIDEKYPNLAAIDIGANIGDSAAAICSCGERSVLCIEGNREFLPFLLGNAPRISKSIVVEGVFTGPQAQSVDASAIDARDGTASLVGALSEEPVHSSASLRPLSDILGSHPRFAEAAFVKIDTDGMDFAIIRDSAQVWRDLKPILLFEYDLAFSPNALLEAQQSIRVLEEAGYSGFGIYDNFGNFMASFESSISDHFSDLNAYLVSNQRNGVAVHYLDVCAFHSRDLDLWSALRSREHQLALGGGPPLRDG